jgi:hypothetical protein
MFIFLGRPHLPCLLSAFYWIGTPVVPCHNSVFCEPRLCLLHAFYRLIRRHPVPFEVIRLMAPIRIAGRYRLREKIASGPSRTYGAIALSYLAHRPG